MVALEVLSHWTLFGHIGPQWCFESVLPELPIFEAAISAWASRNFPSPPLTWSFQPASLFLFPHTWGSQPAKESPLFSRTRESQSASPSNSSLLAEGSQSAAWVGIFERPEVCFSRSRSKSPPLPYFSYGASVHVTVFTPRRIPLCRAFESGWLTLEGLPLCRKEYGEEGMNVLVTLRGQISSPRFKLDCQFLSAKICCKCHWVRKWKLFYAP